MSTINVNYMTGNYSHFAKNQAVKKSSGNTVADAIADKCAENRKAEETARTAKAETVSTKDMTMEEYKQYIHDRISEIPIHPSRMQESISITISEAGFEAMKNDPEYEAWVLNDLQTGWAQPDRWSGICGAAYSTIYYGATKEECHAEMWSAGYQNGSGKNLYDTKSESSFWERRIESKKRLEAQMKKRQEKGLREEAAEQRRQLMESYNERLLKAEVLQGRLFLANRIIDADISS